MKPALVLDNINIRQHGGLFSLNDLHRASGGHDRHQPAKFLRLDATRALIAEVSNSPDVASYGARVALLPEWEGSGDAAVSTKEGKGGGTYACRELVIAYASWISAAFHLKVIRVFLGGGAPPSFSPARQTSEAAKVFAAAFRVARLIGCDKSAAAISANQYARKHVHIDLLEDLGHSHLLADCQQALFLTPTELGQQLNGVSGRQVNVLLAECGLQSKASGVWLPTEKGLPYARILDTGKKHSDGTLVQQVKWRADVLRDFRLLRPHDCEQIWPDLAQQQGQQPKPD